MTAYILLSFLLLQDGDIKAYGGDQMFVGADACLESAEVLKQELSQDKEVVQFTVQCVGSKLYPGVRS